MIREVDAIYSDGVFVPAKEFSLPDRTRVHLIVQASGLEPPESGDPAAARADFEQMIERMKHSNVSAAAFPISRDDLHERR